MCMLGINNRDGPSGISLFFITHGYNIDAVQVKDIDDPSPEDPLPSQRTDDDQPPPILVTDDTGETEEEYTVEKIIGTSTLRGRRVVLVKWEGYANPTWEPLENFKETAALDAFEALHRDAETHDIGPISARSQRRRR